jgi:hypothetical protein
MTFTGTRLYEAAGRRFISNNSRWQISSTLLSPEQINCGKFPVLFPFSAPADESEFHNASHCAVHSIHAVKIAFGTQS